MNIFSNLIMLTLTIGSLCGTVPVNTANQLNDGQYIGDDTGSQILFNIEDSAITGRVTKINNEVNNMLDGKASPSEVHDDIFDEKFFAKERGRGMAGEELGENGRFIEYLNTASGVVDAYTYESSDLQDKIDLMNAKKDLI